MVFAADVYHPSKEDKKKGRPHQKILYIDIDRYIALNRFISII
jgi:hypothetical protein